MAQRLSLRYFLRLWVLSKGMYRSQWRWRRVISVLFFFRKARQVFGKGNEVVSTTTMRPGTALYIGTGNLPVKVKRGRDQIEVSAEGATG